jgi:hypothetical protein
MDQQAERRARRGRMREVVPDLGVVQAQRAAGRVVVVALLRHRQADDAGVGMGDALDDRLRALGGDEQLAQRADHLQLLALHAGLVDVPKRERVEAGLRLQRVAGVGAAQ